MTTNLKPLAYPHFRNDLKDKEMITKNTKILTIGLLLTTSIINAGVVNPFSECNTKQAYIMGNKCEKLNGRAYDQCERETLKEFFKCVSDRKGAKDGN